MESFDELKNALNDIANYEVSKNPLVFTRYLYPKEQVNHSLLLALLDRNLDEALFWTYEQYHSGFEEELYAFIESIYEMFYSSSNGPALGKCISDLYSKWTMDKSQHHIFGSIVKNLICRPYNVNQFIETYMGAKCEPYCPNIKDTKFLRINFTAEEATKYETHPPEYQKARTVLSKVCLYAIRHNALMLFKSSNPNIKEQYCYDWTYYCWDCPYWRALLEDKYNGKLNHETKRVDFEDEADFDDFYDHFGYEPDEQKAEVQAMSIGRGDEVQMNIKDFAERYGGTMVKRTIKIRGNQGSPVPPP